MHEEESIPGEYPLSRVMHIIALVLSAVLLLVGIHILMQEEQYENELYFYWFISIYITIAMLVKMFMVVHGDHSARSVVVGFLMEFCFFLPIVLNPDWQSAKMEFALAMLITSVIRTAYYTMAVMKNSQLV